MPLRVLLFGVLRELVGAPECDVELALPATAGEVVERVRARAVDGSPGIWNALAVAVNEEYVARGTLVRPGDAVALLPPVSGG